MKVKVIVDTKLHYLTEGSSWGYHPYSYKPISLLENAFIESNIMQYLIERKENVLHDWDYLDREYIYIFKLPLKEKSNVKKLLLNCQMKFNTDFRIKIS